MTYHLMYNPSGWSIGADANRDYHYVGPIRVYRTWDDIITSNIIDANIANDPTSDCKLWMGHTKNNGYRRIPYYAPGMPHLYPHSVPVRQLLLARHLGIQYGCLPPRMRIACPCTNDCCVELEHMLPPGYLTVRRTDLETSDQRTLVPDDLRTHVESGALQRAIEEPEDEQIGSPKELEDQLAKFNIIINPTRKDNE
jgi:hypothetical protein